MSGVNSLQVDPEAGVAERLRLARAAAGLTRKEMARALGVSLATYIRMEDGKREPRRGELIALAQITGQDVAFFGGESSSDPRVVDSGASGPHPLGEVKPDNGDEDEV